jgi:nicotinamide-nucleotide amidase
MVKLLPETDARYFILPSSKVNGMRAEIIAIGDELTSGQRLDTNSQWLAERLEELGVPVMFHSTVGDDLEANVQVFRIAAARAQVIVVTGGLGPTADDLTRQALADAAGVDLVRDDASLEHIQKLFARRGRAMPPANEIQAMFPRGATAIHNPHGSAPGIDFVISTSAGDAQNRARFFCLPGVPAEMKEMWQGTVAGAVAAMQERPRVIANRRIKCFGVGESDLEAMLPDLIRRGRDPRVGITVSQATITLRITASGEDDAACRKAMEPTEKIIRECLGELVFGYEDDELQQAVARKLIDRGEKLAVFEVGTAGQIAKWLGGLPNVSQFLAGAIVEPSHGHDRDDIQAWISSRAKYVRELFQADYGLAVGPFPPLAKAGELPANIWFALSGPNGESTKRMGFAGHPDILRSRYAKAGLDFVRLGK